MPRKIRTLDEMHREEQRRYRQRLRADRKPEIAQVDTAVTAGVHALLRRSVVGSRASSEAAAAIIRDASLMLVGMGYDHKEAARLLRRRLSERNPRFERLIDGDGQAHSVNSI
jgi:hypothetical protein